MRWARPACCTGRTPGWPWSTSAGSSRSGARSWPTSPSAARTSPGRRCDDRGSSDDRMDQRRRPGRVRAGVRGPRVAAPDRADVYREARDGCFVHLPRGLPHRGPEGRVPGARRDHGVRSLAREPRDRDHVSRDIDGEEPDMSAAGEIWNAAQMEAMAARLDAELARSVLGIQTFINTTPERHEVRERDGVQQHLVNGEPALPPVFGLTAAELLVNPPADSPLRAPPRPAAEFVTGPDGGIYTCTCGTGVRSAFADHARHCPVYRLLGAKITAPEPSGRPEKEDDAGIPLWDEDKHAALAEMSGPLTLPESRLPAYDAVPPGCCTGCHLPVPAGQATCTYCDLAKQSSIAASTAIAKELDGRKAPSPVADELAARRKICDHGGPRLAYARAGKCTRCGQFIASRACEHGSRMQCPQCWRPSRQSRGYPFFLLGLALVLFISAVPIAPVLVFPAVMFAALGLNGIRRRR